MNGVKRFYYLLFLWGVLITSFTFAADLDPYQQRLGKFSVMLGSGVTGLESWHRTVINLHWTDGGEVVYTGELAYTFAEDHILTRLLSPVFNSMQLASNYTFRNSWRFRERTSELNLYIIAKFDRFPWRKYLVTTVGIGEGLSYDFHLMSTDKDDLEKPNSEYNKLLNYLVIDLSFALPKYPKLELLFRYYHRCSCFHLFPKYGRVGCTGMLGGIRWYLN